MSHRDPGLPELAIYLWGLCGWNEETKKLVLACAERYKLQAVVIALESVAKDGITNQEIFDRAKSLVAWQSKPSA